MSSFAPTPEVLAQMLALADEKLAAANANLNGGWYRDANSRAYYGAFHAVSAVLALKGLVYRSHAQTIGAFNREIVKAGEMPRDSGRLLQRLFIERQRGDYDWGVAPTHEQAKTNVEAAATLVSHCRAYVSRGGRVDP